MLGWHISVYRQADGGAEPARDDSAEGARLAVWQAQLEGLGWIQALLKTGEAIDLGGNGYPFRFTARAASVLPAIAAGIPYENLHWLHGPEDVLLPEWLGHTAIDSEAVAGCRPDEWLLIVAWDES